MVLLAGASLAMADTKSMAVPGTVNYVEGQVALDGQNLPAKQNGSTLLETNQVLDTGQGKAELLLTPGVYFRLGDNSEVRMVSPGLADTRVELVKGSAMLEVDQLYKENDLSVMIGATTTRIDTRVVRFSSAAGRYSCARRESDGIRGRRAHQSEEGA